jgi:hypothetical protein
MTKEEYHEYHESQESLIDREESECPMCGSRKPPKKNTVSECYGLKRVEKTCVDCKYEYIF